MMPAVVTRVWCLLLILWAATTCASDRSQVSAVSEGQAGDLYGNLENVDFSPKCSCCDIAYMDTFKTNGLRYTQTPEFADAVSRVANGESRYSPRTGKDIPFADWKVFATELRRHLAAGAPDSGESSVHSADSGPPTDDRGLSLLAETRCLIPPLLYLASLEYRSKSGQAGIKPIFPRLLRAAAGELDARVGEKRKMAAAFAKRAAAIKSKIAKAEQTAGKNCSHDQLAHARFELECACRDAMGVRVSLPETETEFARAEKVADDLFGR